ncbi:glycoside hydrolase family 65 protein [Pseudonocardia charpentierae]|uniref:Glycosyl hydrolase family 65 protein n=1 Tax=Pseudonocardia charpentierae TaxID=3075545 RepID=A0ABU2N4Z3_9PSEU|nr:glycosyl hydrolase family 65 protein [Pseudonocardia sp. DSM 45834]MDT0348374.1 glycosyl hydrolase family 65 protein [Pseudonocardia sp. DSM 45834]
MTTEDTFTVEPWCLREPRLELDQLASTEAVLTVANGSLGVRGTLDEGEPVGMPGTYLAGVHELRTMVYTETGSGDPESTETLVNTIDGTAVRLLVDGHPLDVRTGTLLHHERVLDFRAGTLSRELRWRSPDGRSVEVTSTRLVSLDQRGVLALRYAVRALERPVEVVLQSGLVANTQQPHLPSHPSAVDLLEHPLEPQEHDANGRLTLVHRTLRTGLLVGATAHHDVESPAELDVHGEATPDHARFTVRAKLEPGESVTLTKLVAYAWSDTHELPALRDELAGALTVARHEGFDGLLASQRTVLDGFWECADVEIDGDDELQQAVRFALFQLLQATARAEGRAVAGKALTGTGYEGHAFWDTETFVLQVMTAVRPEVTRHALGWRHATLPAARERATTLDLKGAAFPWRTITGPECSGYWPAGTAAFHVNADVADAVLRYVDATGDEEFAREAGVELLVESARLWCSLGHWGRDERFHVFGVTGPDEYSALGDDNVYTNLMLQRNLRGAARWVRRYPQAAEPLEVTLDEVAAWEQAADAVCIPYDDDLGVHPQSAGFTLAPRWDFAGTPEENYPLHSHYPYLQLYRKQVVKQADLVLALFLRGDAFTDEEKLRDFTYYEEITVRDSSLSACCQAVLAAEVGLPHLAHEYVVESALADIRDPEHDSSDGLHVAALAGTWLALVCGFGGLRQVDDGLSFRPVLPDELPRLRFRLLFRGRLLRVTVEPGQATYELLRGEPLTVRHERDDLELAVGVPVTRPTRPRPRPPLPSQPETRAPGRGTLRDDSRPGTPASAGHHEQA